ncbi:glycosyltransferase family 2 protein [Labrys wisconsinensis]|uniref:Glycosyltransferase involved in cell wall biosynthesis n=2 Tax=Pseudomonadota TaxID=1224 RepID=A0ABU0J535_9HYPH|nr:glycosyltransferase family 2 protein [Labrys wisconsinensis]MDQ0469374.1 glycosyltransferase involved in cell wall biosynthesis [Labrys wisconsinensis]
MSETAQPRVEPAAQRSAAPRIAVLVPCYNEATTIATVVRDFLGHLPGATVYVYDNNSRDGTAEIAAAAGAVVRRETRQGKGHVMRRMFADIDADIYVMVDGDDTYDAASAPLLVARLREGPYDLVNGARIDTGKAAYRPGHRFGNRLLTGLVSNIFGIASRDMLSGYKALSRRFVKSFPALSTGFEIETELLVHALELNIPASEVDTPYKERPAGSESKLRTVQDGLRILRLITRMVKAERPLLFFSAMATVLALLSIGVAIPVFIDFVETGLVPRLPSAVLSVGLMLSAIISFFSGLILSTVTRGRRELKRLRYLAFAPVW